ncbi:UNVERIFIED_CONTAM: hypothetical protein Sindi_0852600 [Sesamum indicum]
MDFRYLMPWARHILTEEEAAYLVEPFTTDDVKNVIFDIAEDKAPRPNGYSSGFYKAAWSVVGQEVTKTVLDFFSTGKLLKQINCTLLALIPKAAFIPCRSIGDNIMLAQELFTGYDQTRLPPRCALKVDIRKAYDTVEWDFLLLVLQLFGFPVAFSRWIEECVTSPSFSGLRQVNLLSPYLFVLTMEVVHMRFLQLIEQDLTLYSSLKRWAGSICYMIGATTQPQDVNEWEGHLQIRYLGLPLTSSKLSIFGYQPLLIKIDEHINEWEGLALPYVRRVQILKSVLMALSVYWASAFILTKGVIKDIEKRLWAFLWKGTGTSGCESSVERGM